jgi:hypothetical protein
MKSSVEIALFDFCVSSRFNFCCGKSKDQQKHAIPLFEMDQVLSSSITPFRLEFLDLLLSKTPADVGSSLFEFPGFV